MQTNKNIPRTKELSFEHLRAFKDAFDKITGENFLSKADRKEQLSIYNQLRDMILVKRPGS